MQAGAVFHPSSLFFRFEASVFMKYTVKRVDCEISKCNIMKRKVLFLTFAALFCLFTIKAQAQSIFHRYLQNNDDAIEYIGSLFHPAQDVLDTEYVKGTSSYIDINIKFEGLMRNYWEPYRINLKQYNGVTYAYSIVKTKPSHDHIIPFDFSPSIIRSVADYMGFSTSDSDEAIRVLYGTTKDGLTYEQKAAILLMNYLYGD